MVDSNTAVIVLSLSARGTSSPKRSGENADCRLQNTFYDKLSVFHFLPAVNVVST